jgi:type IV pilus assembly protein PilP
MIPTEGKSRVALVALGTLIILLAGCSDHEDIKRWMDEQRQASAPKIQPIKAPTPFVPAAYTTAGMPDPFGIDRLTQALRAQNAGNDALLRIEQKRRKEPLEAVGLDNITMVGSIDRKGQQVALIKANNLIYQVRVGNYMGQDYGKITKITENTIELREVVQDGTGAWVEHNTTLQLQESQEK